MSEERPSSDRGLIALAERILGLLDEGVFTATYKYAVLLGLIDLCLENTGKMGEPPDTLYTGQLAEKIVELYWPHCVPYVEGDADHLLRQNSGRQAKIVSDISKFRAAHGRESTVSTGRAHWTAPRAFDRLIHEVEWTLIKMPLPKLQRVGNEVKPFLYRIAWDDDVTSTPVRRHQKGEKTAFDNRIVLEPGVGAGLVALNGLLRPLIHRQWAAKVAKLNDLHEARLESFLFGADRISLEPVRAGLRDLQANRCFYCGERIGGASEVDHFIPWSRYPDNSIHNLVLADRGCNNNKRDHIAASALVSSWAERNATVGAPGRQLEQLAEQAQWEVAPDRPLKVARGIYAGLPEDAQVWLRRDTFVPLERKVALAALG